MKKLLNVALLLERGLKISKIAGLSPKQLGQMVAEGPSVSDEGGEALAKQRLKLAMMTYDEVLFRGTMQDCVDRLTFDGAVLSVALPFLAEVGVLWLTDTICPAHEHFMSGARPPRLTRVAASQTCSPCGIAPASRACASAAAPASPTSVSPSCRMASPRRLPAPRSRSLFELR